MIEQIKNVRIRVDTYRSILETMDLIKFKYYGISFSQRFDFNRRPELAFDALINNYIYVIRYNDFDNLEERVYPLTRLGVTGLEVSRYCANTKFPFFNQYNYYF